MKKFIVVLIVIAMLATVGCQSNITNSKKQGWEKSKYFAVRDGQLGLLTLPEEKFIPFKINIRVKDILGVRDSRTILVVGKLQKPEVSSSLYEVYQIDIDEQSAVSLADNVENAYMSPDRRKIIYTTLNQTSKEGQLRLYCKFLDSNKEPFLISGDVVDRPWWAGDGNRIVFTSMSSKGQSIIVHDLRTEISKEVSTEIDTNPVASGWIGNNEVIFRNKSGVHFLHDVNTNNKYSRKLFDVSVAEVIHDIRDNLMLISILIIDQESPKNILSVISRNDPKKTIKIVEFPLYNHDYGYRSAVFFEGMFISNNYVFYRVLTAENYDSVAVGIVDIRTKVEIKLDKEFELLYPYDDKAK